MYPERRRGSRTTGVEYNVKARHIRELVWLLGFGILAAQAFHFDTTVQPRRGGHIAHRRDQFSAAQIRSHIRGLAAENTLTSFSMPGTIHA
jgi:hypothetical protein